MHAQIAAADKVFIFDLLHFKNRQSVLSNCLTHCLGSKSILKIKLQANLGLKLEEDFQKLHERYKGVSAFQKVLGCLDLG